MYIVKVINNNVISALDQSGAEIVAMGKGIGFGRKAGDVVEDGLVEKIFRMENEEILKRFKDLLADLPLEHIQVSNEIISYSKNLLGIRLNQNIYITLTDHINFAIVRHQEGMLFQNALSDEVRAFYPEEYGIGRYALKLILERIGVELPEDEAASIAMHLITAEYNTPVRNVFKISDAVKRAAAIAKERLGLAMPGDTLYWNQFMINLKFLGRTLCQERAENREGGGGPVYDFIRVNRPAVYACAEEIAACLEKECGQSPVKSDRAYLAMDLLRLQDHDHDKLKT